MLDVDQIELTIITVILTFIFGYGLSLVNDFRRGRLMKIKSISSMIAELEQHKTDIQNHKVPSVEHYQTNQIRLHLISFQTAAFDSMKFSQIFRDLDPQTQVKVAFYYENMEITNRNVTKLLDQNLFGSRNSSDFIENVDRLGASIDERIKNHDKEASELISHLKTKKPHSLICQYNVED